LNAYPAEWLARIFRAVRNAVDADPNPAKLAHSAADIFQVGKLGVSIAFLVYSEPNPGPSLTIDPNPHGAFPAY
jgi:hypothetical protein